MNKKIVFLFCLLSGIVLVQFFRLGKIPVTINTSTSSSSTYKQPLLNITQTTPNTWKIILPADLLWVETSIDVSEKTVKITRIAGTWTNDKNSKVPTLLVMGGHLGLTAKNAYLFHKQI